jgi:hypothetical protein
MSKMKAWVEWSGEGQTVLYVCVPLKGHISSVRTVPVPTAGPVASSPSPSAEYFDSEIHKRGFWYLAVEASNCKQHSLVSASRRCLALG